MANTIRALKRFQKAVQLHVVDRVRAVATSAMRDARNAAAFTAWVKSATGWQVEVVSGLEEGRLIHLGVVSQEAGRAGALSADRPGRWKLRDYILRRGTDPPDGEPAAGRGAIAAGVSARRSSGEGGRGAAEAVYRPRIAKGGAQAGESAGGAGDCDLGDGRGAGRGECGDGAKLPTRKTAPKSFERIKPSVAKTAEVRRLAERLAKMTNAQRASIPGIGTRRSEIVVGGAMVYASLLERMGLRGFRYSPSGLKDGILAQMLADADLRASVHRKIENERWAGVLEVCKRYGVDMKKAEPVRQHVVGVYDELARVHELPPEYRLWLEAAAMMQDVGKYMNHQGHHRHTQYIVANSEIFGFSPEQRGVVGAIARYMGKSRPEPVDRILRTIAIEEHPKIVRAVVLLRLALALNQDRASAAVRMRTHVYSKRVLLELLAGRGGAELEAWSLRKEADYFREVFRRDLAVEVA